MHYTSVRVGSIVIFSSTVFLSFYYFDADEYTRIKFPQVGDTRIISAKINGPSGYALVGTANGLLVFCILG